MKKQFKLGVIGCGIIGSAIVKGAALSDFIRPKKIVVSDINDEPLDKIDECGVVSVMDNEYVAANCEYLLLAVTAQNLEEVANEIRNSCPQKIISVIPDVTKNRIKNLFGIGVKVAKCVPNLPCSRGSGMTGVDMTDFNKSPDDAEFISNLFNCMGTVLSVNEDKLDAVNGISGNGSAYAFMFIDALIDAGVKQGLTKDEAKIIAVQTVWGCADMILNGDESVSELLMRSCNKSTPTMEGIKVLKESNFDFAVLNAVNAGVNKLKEIKK